MLTRSCGPQLLGSAAGWADAAGQYHRGNRRPANRACQRFQVPTAGPGRRQGQIHACIAVCMHGHVHACTLLHTGVSNCKHDDRVCFRVCLQSMSHCMHYARVSTTEYLRACLHTCTHTYVCALSTYPHIYLRGSLHACKWTYSTYSNVSPAHKVPAHTPARIHTYTSMCTQYEPTCAPTYQRLARAYL